MSLRCMHRRHITDLLVVLPVLPCILVYFLDLEIKKALTLIPSNYTLLTIFTTNFHYSIYHLVGNILWYTLFGFCSLVVYSRLNLEKVFRYSLVLILFTVPLASSVSSILFLPEILKSKPSYGFSAIVSDNWSIWLFNCFMADKTKS